MTKIHQFAKQSVDKSTEIAELSAVGFYDDSWRKATLLRHLLYHALPEYHSLSSKNMWLDEHLATPSTSILTFITDKQALTKTIFYTIASQLLGYDTELTDNAYDGQQVFKSVGWETTDVSDIYHAWYLLLNTHTKNGLLFIDELASHGYFKTTNQRIYFNGKSMATYDTTHLVQETVWVETSVDSDLDGQLDLIQVDIQRPDTTEKLPALFTASPYYQGMMLKENDAKVHHVNVPLVRKVPKQVARDVVTYQVDETVNRPFAREIRGVASAATKTFTTLSGHAWDLNNYFLSRGFAVAYASGIGTRHSDGMQDTGSPDQVESMKNVVEWLAGNRVAFTDRTSQIAIKADWSNHKIAMTGRSYLGTLATAVAATGVAGLETVIAEASISDWYQYYRDNGLVIAPGGFPGEDMDVLAELVYSRMKDPADWTRTQKQWQQFQTKTKNLQDRENGNYNIFWDARNYLNRSHHIKTDIVLVHGLNDWNVKPRQVYRLWQALRGNGYNNKLILHQGQHININNNRSLDFADQMNLWLVTKLLGQPSQVSTQLPNVIWQDNTQSQSWHGFNEWGTTINTRTYHLAAGQLVKHATNGEVSFTDQLSHELFEQSAKYFSRWRDKTLRQSSDLSKTQQHFKTPKLVDDQFIDGEVTLTLRVKSSQNIGLISAMLLDYGADDYLKSQPTNQGVKIDRGVNFAQVDLQEFEMEKANYKLITLGHINLQNRTNVWQTDDLKAEQYVTVNITLQPTLYHLRAGHQLGLIVYATDFEMTIRGNQGIVYTIDLAHSLLTLPAQNNTQSLR
ncbi:x-prolyl-dipeptidyl aminopeptidase [Leuconostoc kimchii IMSNU 11154]|uniref:Xaa-Pro dipeptidyl-peptidase n=1 Tax=Leuconostoc kimchii (strain IMSNU 11154 / KCTC 2386 / IH25) TaxID=762051 RepID=D5T1F7_LEUKI|nr:Xaa-Pro dipeptidyl-peptidase [Leuconostoc kimchii]ADG40106.1 x-prolyl-dipeptidyl aminopeptidase [Leuconostoc kimchii IMSNU 11154]